MKKAIYMKTISRSLSMGVALLFLPGAGTLIDVRRYPPATPPEKARVIRAFRDAAMRSVGPRSGDLFALPEKYNYFIDKGNNKTATASVFIGGRRQELATLGTSHATSWDYDARLPFVLYGPGFVKKGQVFDSPIAQQDLVPTYAKLLGIQPPEDAEGRPLTEALLPGAHAPRVILTVVFDQVGSDFLNFHPRAYPFVRSLMQRGSNFTNARIRHADAETFVGHISIGTGAYPGKTSVPANRLWLKSRGETLDTVNGETVPSPILIESPSLADVWLDHTKNEAIVVGQSLADRAAIGMVGHGSLYRKNKKPFLNFFDSQSGGWTTNEKYYSLPESLKEMNFKPYSERLGGAWLGHSIAQAWEFRRSAAVSAFEGEAFFRTIEQEPVGQDEVTDLLFLSFKGSDYAGHAFGQESLEAEETLRAQDSQFERIFEFLEKKVGKDNLLVAFLADHGGAPLCELSGGTRLVDRTLLGDLDKKFDHLDNGVSLAEHAGGTQIFLNDREMSANGVTLAQVKEFVAGYRVKGRLFFAQVFSKEDLKKNK